MSKHYKRNTKSKNYKPKNNGPKKSKLPSYIGTYCATTRGFGFVVTDELEDDIFIPQRRTGGAMDGDIVRVEVTRV